MEPGLMSPACTALTSCPLRRSQAAGSLPKPHSACAQACPEVSAGPPFWDLAAGPKLPNSLHGEQALPGPFWDVLTDQRGSLTLPFHIWRRVIPSPHGPAPGNYWEAGLSLSPLRGSRGPPRSYSLTERQSAPLAPLFVRGHGAGGSTIYLPGPREDSTTVCVRRRGPHGRCAVRGSPSAFVGCTERSLKGCY